MLNYLWFAFFAVAALAGGWQWLYFDKPEVMNGMAQSLFTSSKLGFEVALGLTGTLCVWLGLLKVAEKAGLVSSMARGLSPLFEKLMPELPKGHPSIGSMTMNMSANILGLDNAATPVGLKAMEEMQTLNQKKDTAMNAQILFLVINASSITLLPVTIFMYRAQAGAANPADVFVPILLATSVSTLAGFLSVAWIQKLPIFNRVVMAYLGVIVGLVALLAWYFSSLAPEAQKVQSALIGNVALVSIVMLFLTAGIFRKVPVYEAFIEGAKEGFTVAIKLIPYLVAMLVAVGMLRASGAFDGLLQLLSMMFTGMGVDTSFVPALPTGLIKPFSGGAARAMMLDVFQTHGVDSFPARVAAVIQGSTETTFYVIAVYFGSVGITKVRHAVACGLIADFAGILAAIAVCYWFYPVG